MKLPTCTLLAALGLLCACQPASGPATGEIQPIPFPGQREALAPKLTAGNDGVVLLSWLERQDAGATLWYSRLTGDTWSTPSRVVDDAQMFVNWADIPSVNSLGGGHLVAHWLSYSAPGKYAYDVRVSQSLDDGESWSAAITPHTDGTPTEHGFVSVWPAAEGTGLLWLDGRNTIAQAGADASAAGMTLRSATVSPDGTVSGKQMVDGLVCDCCQTDVALGSRGPIALYRDRTVEETRDIYISRRVDGKWTEGVALSDDGWEIAACPVNGPALAATGNKLVAAWFTAAGDTPKVLARISTDGGASFGASQLLSASGVAGHVDVAASDGGLFAVSWVEQRDSQWQVRLQLLGDDGPDGEPITVGRSDSRFQVPQLAANENAFVIAWTTDVDGQSIIETARIPILSR